MRQGIRKRMEVRIPLPGDKKKIKIKNKTKLEVSRGGRRGWQREEEEGERKNRAGFWGNNSSNTSPNCQANDVSLKLYLLDSLGRSRDLEKQVSSTESSPPPITPTPGAGFNTLKT